MTINGILYLARDAASSFFQIGFVGEVDFHGGSFEDDDIVSGF